MKLKKEMWMFLWLIDQWFIPYAFGDYIYILGRVYTSKIFKHKVSYDFLNLLEVDSERRSETLNIVDSLVNEFKDFTFDTPSNIELITLQDFRTLDASSYYTSLSWTDYELSIGTLKELTKLVEAEQGSYHMFANKEKWVLYFTNDKKELCVIISLTKKQDTLF